MKARLVLILAVLAILVAGASVFFLFTPRFLWSYEPALREEGLREGETILVKTRAERFGVQKGDVFSYLLEVWYNPDQVSEIDRASLDEGVSLEPFEIRGSREREFDLDSRTRVYRREYEVQLIDGEVDQWVEFPTLVVRYKSKGSEGLLEKRAVLEPVYVASRLSPDVADLELGYGPLRPVKGQVENVGHEYLPWILWALGGFLAVLGVADLAGRAIPQWKETAKQRRRTAGIDVLSEAYHSLHKNAATAGEPRRVLHQIEHILRVVLARKEKLDWLEEPDLEVVTVEIRPSVISLFEKCQKVYQNNTTDHKEVEEALSQLEGILAFYFGAREVEAWRN